jgi:hypothetical protein
VPSDGSSRACNGSISIENARIRRIGQGWKRRDGERKRRGWRRRGKPWSRRDNDGRRRDDDVGENRNSDKAFWGGIGNVGCKMDNEWARRFQIKLHPRNLQSRLDVQPCRMQSSVPVGFLLNDRQEGVILDVDEIDDAETVHSP